MQAYGHYIDITVADGEYSSRHILYASYEIVLEHSDP